MAETRITELIQRWKRQQQARGQWPHHWEDLSRVMLSRRLGFVTDVQPGARRVDELFDGTAMQSARALANAVGGMTRPEGEKWFFLKTADEADEHTDEAKDWLADSEERMRQAFDDPRARLRQATGEVDLDLVVLGTAVMFIGEVVGRNQLVFQSVYLNDALPFYDETGNVEGMFRTRRLTLRQAEARWGLDKLSEVSRKNLADDKGDTRVEFLFVTVPREEGRKDAVLARNLPIAQIVIEIEAKHEVAQGGYHEFPYIVPRWDTSSGEDYGRSPGMIALPDANTSQAIGETMLVAGQRAADPPLLAPSDAFIDAPHTFPGGIAAYEAEAVRDLGNNPIRELLTGRNFPLTRDIQRDTREQIRIAFLRNVFNLPMPGEAKMTATEVIARLKEFIREMGPVFGRFETDYTAPLVERSFRIMLRAGAFAPIPQVLSEKTVRFEYESPVKKIRRMMEVAAAREWTGQLIEMAQAQMAAGEKPEALDLINVDALARFSAEAASLPHEIVNGTDEVARIRKLRAEVEEAARQAAAIQQAAEVAETVAGAADKAGLTEAA